MQLAFTIMAAVCALLAVAGAAYFALCVWAAGRFLRASKTATPLDFEPPVSVMKSLKGLDPQMYAAFRSHCLLDYGQFEILFGASDADEPALELVQRLQREFPQRQIRVVHCPQSLGLNGKVSTLAQMVRQAKYEHILINDSDIMAPPDYLRRVMSLLADERVGMVTSLYRGLAGQTLPSKLEALGLSTDFTGGVLVAREMEGGMRFALGATMATTKTVLGAIGGLEALADYLGDDYELGARTAAAGYRVELADVVVETALPDYTFGEFWAHQMRWARNVRDRRRAQYFGLMVTFGLAWGILAVLIAPQAWWTWAALTMVAVSRMTAAVVIGLGVVKDPYVLRDLWLVPVRDFAGLGVWVASFAGNEIEWRGLRFRVRNGKLQQR
ncbi:MAG TPA: bacteriohopanetetrol glucosamine biosynthesis glycosyltransferase HpnI [Candidatus Eisenbacteria bacterium]|nr:bacteriohopanetetrol glucosamine biosynthesis glycosyltransferase HpnI [Candidatus Eisenbacteria bacterium]